MSHAPLIGILAGMGPRSTAPFIDLLVTECQRQYGALNDADFPPMMVYSLPAPFYPERPIDHAAMEEALHAGLAQLAQAGAHFMAIACNTAHVYFPQLARRAAVPLLDMVGATVAALPATSHRVAIIAARPTMEAGIYQQGLATRGFLWVDPGWQAGIDKMITTLHTPVDNATLTAHWRTLDDAAAAAGADTIVLACADLSAASMPLGGVVVDATKCLARAVVVEWLRRRQRS